MRLLLFDIDGTLTQSSGAGRAALVAALEAVFGSCGPVENYQMAGKTDPLIISDLMSAAGIPGPEIQARLTEVYNHMAQYGPGFYARHVISPTPGASELLAALSQREGILLGLLTGNISQTAPLKLVAAGIDPALFRVGAYGSDAIDRDQLPALAMRRARELTGVAFEGGNTIIIGDTPADILCARAGGATAVAIASGIHSAATLAQYQPDHLLESLIDTKAVLDILLSPNSQPAEPPESDTG